MEKLGAYGVYQKNYAEAMTNRNENAVGKTEENNVKNAEKTGAAEKVNLSRKAKELLKELQKQYGNMDFMVANYETDEEASRLLSRGTKEYSVLIDPDTLEKMAADDEEKAKYMNLLEEATGTLADMKSKVEESGEQVTRFGFTIEDDGIGSFFALLEKINDKQDNVVKSAFIEAPTAEELFEKARNMDWRNVEERTFATSGQYFDFTV